MKEDFYFLLFDFYRKLTGSPYLKIIAILSFAFFFILLLSFVRKRFFQISMRGAVLGFLVGTVLVIFFDLLVIVALSDREKIHTLLSHGLDKEVFSEIMVSGVNNLSKILGDSTIILPAKPKTAQEVLRDFLALPDDEAKKVRGLLCP